MTTTQVGSNGSSADKIHVHAPVSGALLGEVPVMGADEVREVVARARRAQYAWSHLSIRERGRQLLAFRDALVKKAPELIDLLTREAGKPRHEALLHEVAPVADMCGYLASHAGAWLADEERPLHLLRHRKSVVVYTPRGVVGIIAPWNFPVMLPMRDVLAAVIAGNAAVVKPSEVTPLVMLLLKRIWDGSGMPPDLLGVITGRGPTGAALLDAGIDLCVFTGSVATGKRVAAACGERLIPCIMELGGKAPLIACADCDVERTARAIVSGGFANSGQVCLSVERVYAHREVHDQLVDRVVQLTRSLRAGDPAEEFCDIGGITFEGQIAVAEAHIADAVARGAVVRCGGKRRAGARLAFEPTVLSGCTHDCSVMVEEIFGPIVPFMRVGSEDEAIARANDSHLGLNAYVFTEDHVRAKHIAERIEAGSVLVNETLLNGAMVETPFGGIKQSGFGRVFGPEGVRAMCHTKHISLDRVKLPPKNAFTFPYSAKSYTLIEKGFRALFSSGGLFKKLSELV
jgi:acyl-CoA reductase-like NAD-dependent aldehyde dehydrogenase